MSHTDNGKREPPCGPQMMGGGPQRWSNLADSLAWLRLLSTSSSRYARHLPPRDVRMHVHVYVVRTCISANGLLSRTPLSRTIAISNSFSFSFSNGSFSNIVRTYIRTQCSTQKRRSDHNFARDEAKKVLQNDVKEHLILLC